MSKSKKIKIVYMGSPNFSVPSLKCLSEHYNIAACVTQPERPKGRGLKIRSTPVKKAALELGIPVVEPTRLSHPDFLACLKGMSPDLCIGVAFGQLIPKEVLDIPPLGFVNVHPSLLPELRGAAPIQWALINGNEVTGVTTMYMDEGFDTGDIILQSTAPIRPDDNYESLHDRLAEVAAQLLLKTVDLIADGRALRIVQDHDKATWAPHIRAKEERIDWGRSARDIVNHVRALDPAPGASTTLGGKRIKIWRSSENRQEPEIPAPAPGTVIVVDSKEGLLSVATGNGIVNIEEIQREGGRRMATDSFLRGFEMKPGTVFE
jgi:methionyl-tRNA formyltransferase